MDDHCIVVLGADPGTARAAEATGTRIIFVQQPGSAVDRLVWMNSNRCHLYSVDYSSERFLRFVPRVLGPLAPDWVLAAAPDGARAAELARSLLGLGDAPDGPVGALVAAITGAGTARAPRLERSPR